jgi:hypothetical protein
LRFIALIRPCHLKVSHPEFKLNKNGRKNRWPESLFTNHCQTLARYDVLRIENIENPVMLPPPST